MLSSAPVVVVGGGHNGLVAACYLAKAGKRVVVLEAADKPGGGADLGAAAPERVLTITRSVTSLLAVGALRRVRDINQPSGAPLRHLCRGAPTPVAN